MKIKNIRLLFITGVFFLILPTPAAADGPPPPGDLDPALPIDGGCFLLLALGLLLALYTIRKSQRNIQKNDTNSEKQT